MRGKLVVMKQLLALVFLFFTCPVEASLHRIVFLGDSLTEGLELPKEEAYPFLVEKQLREEGFKDVVCINAGISGSTTASAMSRFKWHLKQKPEILILALGANDGLRGMNPQETKKHLREVIAL